MSNFNRGINAGDTVVTAIRVGDETVITNDVIVCEDGHTLYVEVDDGNCNTQFVQLDPITMRLSLHGKDVGRAYMSSIELGIRVQVARRLAVGIQRIMDLPYIGEIVPSAVNQFLDEQGIVDTPTYTEVNIAKRTL